MPVELCACARARGPSCAAHITFQRDWWRLCAAAGSEVTDEARRMAAGWRLSHPLAPPPRSALGSARARSLSSLAYELTGLNVNSSCALLLRVY
jgi:hypothetical protein